MRRRFSRRGWLRGLFAGLAGLAGLRWDSTASSAEAQPEGTTSDFPTSLSEGIPPLSYPISSVTTTTYDARGVVSVTPLGQVTTVTYDRPKDPST